MKDKMTRGRKLKGLFSVVLVLAMVFTLMPLSPHKVHADVSPVSYCLALSDGKVYKNYVHETTVMSAPSGLSYDSTSGEWTMDNFEFAASWGQTLIFYGDIVINLIGENKLTNTLTSSNYCIYSDAAGASVKFKGTGSLVCQCGDTNGTSYAIYVREGSVIVESGVITAEAGSSATKYSYGISCKNLIVNGGTLKATASSAGTNSNGIVADNFTITAGKVEAASGNALNNESLGVFATKLDMSGGELISTGGSATTNSYGVVGGLDLSGGSIVANSGEASNSYGVYIMYNSTFTDGCLKATGEKVGIFDTYGRISVGSGIAVKVGSNAASARIKDPIASLKALLTSTENKYAEILPHTHAVGEKQEAVGGTCKTVGTIEYYKCTDSTCDAKLSSTGTVLSSIAGTKNPSNHEGIATTWGQTTTTHTEKYDCCGGAKSAAEAHSYGTTGASIYTCTVCSYVNDAKKEAAELPDVKAAAKTEIDNAVGTDDSANVVAAADAAKSAIDSALSASAVTSAKNAGLSAIAAAKAENKDADDTAKANAVIAKIDAIGTVALTDASKAKIDAARSAYDALTTDQKAKITAAEYKKLTDAEAKYKELANAGKYEGVEPSSGHVKDITGTEDAPKETNHYSASIKNSSELETLLDVAAADKAQGVNVWIELVEAKDTMPAADKALIEKAAGTKTVGVFLDASLFKKVGDNDAEKVHELNGKIKVSLVVPENIRKTGRTYGIVRVHGGVATPIEGTFDAATHTFTFETDRFSSYALTYEDPASEESGEVAPPKTGDVNMAWVYMLMLLGTAWIGVACYRIKRN